jgi:hypothetical protein
MPDNGHQPASLLPKNVTLNVSCTAAVPKFYWLLTIIIITCTHGSAHINPTSPTSNLGQSVMRSGDKCNTKMDGTTYGDTVATKNNF